jgi:hypothetical protein
MDIIKEEILNILEVNDWKVRTSIESPITTTFLSTKNTAVFDFVVTQGSKSLILYFINLNAGKEWGTGMMGHILGEVLNLLIEVAEDENKPFKIQGSNLNRSFWNHIKNQYPEIDWSGFN